MTVIMAVNKYPLPRTSWPGAQNRILAEQQNGRDQIEQDEPGFVDRNERPNVWQLNPGEWQSDQKQHCRRNHHQPRQPALVAPDRHGGYKDGFVGQ
jgi:hypothetical protein